MLIYIAACFLVTLAALLKLFCFVLTGFNELLYAFPLFLPEAHERTADTPGDL